MAGKELIHKPYDTVHEMLTGQWVQKQLKLALPSMMTVEQLTRVSLTVIRQNQKLLECSPQSLMSCVMGCAMLGLSPEPYLGQAYLVPYWSGKLQALEAQLIPGYRGYITLAKRSGELANLAAQVVYQSDHFQIQFGLIEVLEHIPAEGDRGEVKGAWTVFKYAAGGQTFDYMPAVEINAIRDRSKSKDKQGNLIGPWVTDYAEMAKKTVIRRHMKLAPLSIEDTRLIKAAHAENLALDGDQGNFFLPENAPAEITGAGMSLGGEVRDILAEFQSMMGQDANHPLMGKWLQTCSIGNNNLPIDQVMNEALANKNNFRAAFDQFKARMAKNTTTDPGQNSGQGGQGGGQAKQAQSGGGQDKAQGPKVDPGPSGGVGNQASASNSASGGKKGEMSDEDTSFMNEWFKKQGLFNEYVMENLPRFQAAGAMLQTVARKKWGRIYPGVPWPEDVADSSGAGTGQDQGGGVDENGFPNGDQRNVDLGGDDGQEDPDSWKEGPDFQELQSLKRANFAIYCDLTGGREPKSHGECLDLISEIKNRSEGHGAAD